jgi:hypothetical protein
MLGTNIKSKLEQALIPIIKEAKANSLLVGGTLTVCVMHDGKWKRDQTITIIDPPDIKNQSKVDTIKNHTYKQDKNNPPCVTCGGCNWQQSGACLVCRDCGSSGGCS